MSLLERIRACRRYDASAFVPLLLGGRRIGSVRRSMRTRFSAFRDVFTLEGDALSVNPALDSFELRTEAFHALSRELAAVEVIPPLRHEWFPVVETWGEEPWFKIDRAALVVFGLRAFGVHLNGFVRRPDGLRVWVGRRSNEVTVDPGRLDHLAAGGQPFGLSLADNLAKEAYEEAGLPPELVAQAVPAGHFAYRLETDVGVRNDTLFSWDLELSEDFVPRNRDGEIQGFELTSVPRLLDLLARPDVFKFNVAPVLIGFLARHGALGRAATETEAVLGALAG